ncbi:hypothetical protein ACWEHA_15075 [Amycolatopsis nivea]
MDERVPGAARGRKRADGGSGREVQPIMMSCNGMPAADWCGRADLPSPAGPP